MGSNGIKWTEEVVNSTLILGSMFSQSGRRSSQPIIRVQEERLQCLIDIYIGQSFLYYQSLYPLIYVIYSIELYSSWPTENIYQKKFGRTFNSQEVIYISRN